MALVKRRGFKFDETMSGTYAPIGAPESAKPFAFSVRAHTESAARTLKTGTTYLQGTVRADGLAHSSAAEGTLVFSRRRLRYELEFSGDDGERYRFEGEKRLRFPNLIRSMTLLQGDIVNGAGGVVASAELEFDVRGDLLAFVASWRPA